MLFNTIGLTIGYRTSGKDKILQSGLNLELRHGEIVSLMGQNGVGKTTFLKTVTGLLPSLAGAVCFGEQPLKSYSPNQLAKKISLVLTEKPYSQNLSVLELIAIARHPYSNWLGVLSREDKRAIDGAIDDTKINYLVEKKLYELSDGQMQKVMIAGALAQETELLILDEPAAHLDLNNKIEVMMLLRRIANSGKGVLISTHDLQLSTQLSDRLWLFDFGQQVAEGTPEDLILNGTLEKALYLQNYGYNMVNGSVDLQSEGPELTLTGTGERLFWTSQAIKRNGFKLSESSLTKVICQSESWDVYLPDQPVRSIRSIAALLQLLKEKQ